MEHTAAPEDPSRHTLVSVFPRARPTTWTPEPVAVARTTVDDAAEVLAGLRFTALTGAGISTDSGIPDYRGPDSPPRSPMTYEQFVGDEEFRRHYWARNHVGWQHVNRSLPNAGHRALVRLEERDLVAGIITQNVDLLHEDAGSRNVIDLHGRYDRVICLTCGRVNPGFLESVGDVADIEIAPDADAVIESTAHFRPAPCEFCGGVLKPEIVYFGENVPRERVERAFALVDSADALLVAGSSLTVMSGLRFVRHAATEGKPVVIVNRGITRGDKYATVKIDAGVSDVLDELDRRL